MYYLIFLETDPETGKLIPLPRPDLWVGSESKLSEKKSCKFHVIIIIFNNHTTHHNTYLTTYFQLRKKQKKNLI